MSDTAKKRITVVMADDDEDDCILVKEVFRELQTKHMFFCLPDGRELITYLHRKSKYQDSRRYPWPDIILLDLNMPIMNGREALKALKSDPKTRKIPVIVLTTSREEGDILTSYDAGANSYMVKPTSFEGLIEAMKRLGDFWFDVARLPDDDK